MIQLHSVTKRFGIYPVLNEITMTINTGEIVGIIGGSGVGKSTLLKCINGLETIQSGRIDIFDFTITEKNPLNDKSASQLRRKVGMVFQHLNLWPYRTILENIIEGPVICKRMPKTKAIEQARAIATRFGIEDQLQKYPNALSGGQQQRVAIARAAVMNPAFLLLDEITSALDPVIAGEIAEQLLLLKDQGMGLVFVSHQVDFIRRHADRVFFLHDGNICESGKAKTTLDSPQTKELKDFLSSVRHGW